MNRKITKFFITALVLPFSVFAANENNPKPVEVQGPVDVNVVNSDTLQVELPEDQQVSLTEKVFDPSDILILQSFLSTTSSATELVDIPKAMILRTITVAPSHIDTDPNLFNCGAIVRWPQGTTDPDSKDRIIVDHNWKGTNHISLNYAMPYNVRLPKNSQIETSVGRVGGSGRCEAIIILTGTTVSP